MDDCIFCKIVSGAVKGDLVYQDDDVVAFRDLAPQAPTHVLIVPRRHIATINDIEPDDAAIVGSLYTAAKEIAAAEGGIIVGRGANFILPAERRLSVRVIAPLEMRARKVAEAFGLSIEDARRRVVRQLEDAQGGGRRSAAQDPPKLDLPVHGDDRAKKPEAPPLRVIERKGEGHFGVRRVPAPGAESPAAEGPSPEGRTPAEPAKATPHSGRKPGLGYRSHRRSSRSTSSSAGCGCSTGGRCIRRRTRWR